MTAVLLATLVLGLISRTLPQLNVLVVGFGLNSMLTFAVLVAGARRGRAGVPGPDRADAGDDAAGRLRARCARDCTS